MTTFQIDQVSNIYLARFFNGRKQRQNLVLVTLSWSRWVIFGQIVIHNLCHDDNELLQIAIDSTKRLLCIWALRLKLCHLLAESEAENLYVFLCFSPLCDQRSNARLEEVYSIMISINFLEQEKALNVLRSLLCVDVDNIFQLDVCSFDA